MLDVKRELRRFAPLPVVEADVPPLGAPESWAAEQHKAVEKLGLHGMKTASELKALLRHAQEVAAGTLVAPAQPPANQSAVELERETILKLLPVVDTFDLAYDSILLRADGEWLADFDQFRAMVTGLLEEAGLEHLPDASSPYDPAIHDEVGSVALTDPEYAHLAPGTVAVVYQRGFRYRGEILRRAQVLVAR